MKRLLTTLVSGLKGPRKSPLGRRAQLGVESLEGRLVPSTTAITDMTQWAKQFPGPTEAQELWVNFDGKHNDGQNISAFVPQPGQDRDTAIQDILYRVEEIFSPFNVQVMREKGDGNYSRNYGDTTVFVGGDYANQTTSRSNGLILLSKFAYSQTSFSYSDYASAIRGLDHVPNSDAYDLSFVDPMAYSPSGPFDKGANNATNWVNVEGDTGIAQGIAHEAGHTFGLAHVRTDKNYGTGPFVLDPTPLPTAATAATATAPAVPASANRGTIPDVMSYTDANLYFANATLPVTTFNNSGTGTAQDSREQPLSHRDFYVPQKIEIPINITTQNSFTYLQTVLGARASDGYDHATDPNTVDPSSTNLHAPPSIGPGSGINSPILGGGGTHGVLGRDGDFDAYKLATATVAQQYHINVVSNDILLTNPDVMVRDGNGNVLFFTHAPYGTSARIDFQGAAGQTYFVVVGNEDCSGSGPFTITVTANDPVPVLTGATFTFSSPALPGVPMGRLVVQSENGNSGAFSGVFYDDRFGMGVPVWGTVANTTTVSGVTTSDFSFNGSAQGGTLLEMVQFSGKLTGKVSTWGSSRADTADGTLVDQVFLLPSRVPLWLWGGPATGKDF